ncbi:MAG: NIPSNAP family protein [Adhaeribacter sp.]
MRKTGSLLSWSRTLGFLIAALLMTQYALAFTPPRQEYYEIKVYYLKDKAQEERVHAYLKNAYLPALNRAGVKKVGVFVPVPTDTAAGKRIYVFTPLTTLNQIQELPAKLEKDKQYATAGADYINAVYNNPPYRRMETILLQAFSHMPVFKAPSHKTPPSERVYELRSYEGHTEKIYKNKVKMFNEGGEIKIFDKLGFNAVFYGEVLAGSRMPNLMYMTSFENKASRDAHWKAFGADPDWKVLSGKQEYKNNVSKNTQYFLHPTDYSQI